MGRGSAGFALQQLLLLACLLLCSDILGNAPCTAAAWLAPLLCTSQDCFLQPKFSCSVGEFLANAGEELAFVAGEQPMR